jgi:enoyl-CoA hydratase
MSEEVQVALADGILTVTLNRPAARNAVNRAVAVGVADAMKRLDEDGAIHAAIITGAGGTFCSGMDLKAFVSGELPIVPGRGFAGIAEAPPQKPLIAAVEGFALAGGFEIAITCDLIVAAEDAKFGIPEVKRGLAAGAGGLVRLPRQIPRRVAMELAITGEFITAQRAYELGLVNRVVPSGQALAAATALARTIAANGPLAVRASKQVIEQSQDWPHGEAIARQQPFLDAVFRSADAIEGARAFAEKRAPVWKGK